MDCRHCGAVTFVADGGDRVLPVDALYCGRCGRCLIVRDPKPNVVRLVPTYEVCRSCGCDQCDCDWGNCEEPDKVQK